LRRVAHVKQGLLDVRAAQDALWRHQLELALDSILHRRVGLLEHRFKLLQAQLVVPSNSAMRLGAAARWGTRIRAGSRAGGRPQHPPRSQHSRPSRWPWRCRHKSGARNSF
jgi:hypothetical protein